MARRHVLAPLAASLTCGLVLGACADGPGDDAGEGDDALLRAVQDADYRAWARPPSGSWMAPLQPSYAPHGAFVDVYLNDVVVATLAAAPGTTFTWPEGSIFVLDGWWDAGGEALAFIAIAEKRASGWYWEEYYGDAQERPTYAGAPQVCVGCHAAGSDFIRSVKLP